MAEVLAATWYFWERSENICRDKQAGSEGITPWQRNMKGCLLGPQGHTDRRGQPIYFQPTLLTS